MSPINYVWEMEGNLSARWMARLGFRQRYDHIAKNDLRKYFAKDAKFSEVFQNKFGQVVEKSSDLIFFLLGFIKATKFRDSSRISECVQNVLAKDGLPC